MEPSYSCDEKESRNLTKRGRQETQVTPPGGRGMIRKRIAIWMAVLMIFGLVGGAAHAETVTVSANVLSVDGLRVIATIPAVALLPQQNGTFRAPLIVTVNETLANGSNWSLSAASTNFTGAVSGTVLSASSLALGSTTVTRTLSGGDLTPNATGGTLNESRTLYSEAQTPGVAYSGIHLSSSPLTLTVPNGTPLDLYQATVTVTLISG